MSIGIDGIHVYKISMDNLYDMNRFVKAAGSSNGARHKMNQMKQDSTRESMNEFNMQALQNQDIIKYPVKMTFRWHIENLKKDPDNISSTGRKAILDGMQKAINPIGDPLLPNDNLKHIQGFTDEYILDRDHKPYVEIIIEEIKSVF